MRHTRAHTANRRSHHALKAANLTACENCEAKHRPHHMCQECGFYKGRQVLDLKAAQEKRAARMAAKREALNAEPEEEHEHSADETQEQAVNTEDTVADVTPEEQSETVAEEETEEKKD